MPLQRNGRPARPSLETVREECEFGARASYEYPISDRVVLVALDHGGGYDLHRYFMTRQGWAVRIVAEALAPDRLLAELSRKLKEELA